MSGLARAEIALSNRNLRTITDNQDIAKPYWKKNVGGFYLLLDILA